MTSRPTSPRRRRAQRGSGEQLHAEIIAATKQLLAEGGTADSITIRAVADAVGVTSPSIYLHFDDKQQLLDAVCADVFVELDDAMVKAAADQTTPLGKLHAYGLAYVRFAIDHPEHYRLAMLDPSVESGAKTDDVIVSSCFVHLRETVAECFATGVFTDGDPLAVAFDCWAAVHGVAALLLTKPNVPLGNSDEFAERVLLACGLGHATFGLMGGKVTPERITKWVHDQRSKDA